MKVFALCFEDEDFTTVAGIFHSMHDIAIYWARATAISKNNKERAMSGKLSQYAGMPSLFGIIVNRRCSIISMPVGVPPPTFNPTDKEPIGTWNPDAIYAYDPYDPPKWVFKGANRDTWNDAFNAEVTPASISMPICGDCGYLYDEKWCEDCGLDSGVTEEAPQAKKAKTAGDPESS